MGDVQPDVGNTELGGKGEEKGEEKKNMDMTEANRVRAKS